MHLTNCVTLEKCEPNTLHATLRCYASQPCERVSQSLRAQQIPVSNGVCGEDDMGLCNLTCGASLTSGKAVVLTVDNA